MSYLTKSEYLAQRAQWKQQYAALSKQIRAAKLQYKDDQRNHRQVYPYGLSTLAEQATQMLEDLKELKDVARQSRKLSDQREESYLLEKSKLSGASASNATL